MKTYRWDKLQTLWTDVHEVNWKNRLYLNINGIKFVSEDGKLYEEDPTITPKQREEIESRYEKDEDWQYSPEDVDAMVREAKALYKLSEVYIHIWDMTQKDLLEQINYERDLTV